MSLIFVIFAGLFAALCYVMLGIFFTYRSQQRALLNERKRRYAMRWGSMAGFDRSIPESQELLQ